MPTTPQKLTISMLLMALALPSTSPSQDEKQLSVYSPVATYSLPVVDRQGQDYVGLLELLEPLGRVSSETNGRNLRLRYNAMEAEFAAGQRTSRIGGSNFELGAPFLIENSRGLVPLNSLKELLPRFVETQVSFSQSSRRLFLGNVGIQMSFQLDAGNPPRLTLNFSAPVNPTISTEPGRLRMLFKRDPVVSPGSQAISFDNKVITQATYSENNGNAELDVAASNPLMASFSNDRKTITISAGQLPARSSAGGQANLIEGSNAGKPAIANVNVHRMVAVVDPAHGGEDRGGALTDTLAEKDVTLGFGRLLRHELETRGFTVILLRDSDATISEDQRASTANSAKAGIFISLHAASLGTGARAYSAILPVQGSSNGPFHPWNGAQAESLLLSKSVAGAVVAELQKRQFPAEASAASLRPLNNVLAPAIAVELAPGLNGVSDLASANYQQSAAAAIADAVSAVRDRLGVQP